MNLRRKKVTNDVKESTEDTNKNKKKNESLKKNDELQSSRLAVKNLRTSNRIKKQDTPNQNKNQNVKKFFKSKGMKNENNKYNKNKQPIVKKKISKFNVSDSSFNFHQLSLKESFKRQEVARKLRPRKVKINSDDAQLVTQLLSPRRQNSFVLLDKLDDNYKKLPIYKTIKLDNETKEGSEIYEFDFDPNDTEEKLKKKRKKRPISKKVVTRKKTNQEKKGIKGQIESKKILQADSSQQSIPQNEVLIDNINLIVECENEDLKTVIKPPKNLKKDQIEKKDVIFKKQPVISSIENFKNPITILQTPISSASRDIRPFRATNVFNRKTLSNENTPNNSLFGKSLSPITKLIDNFDPNSPWRPPVLPTFSKIKEVFQSTPQIKKKKLIENIEISPTKIPGSTINTNSVQESLDKDVQVKVIEKNTMVQSPRKFGIKTTNRNISSEKMTTIQSPRKFGTEITNGNNSREKMTTIQSPRKFGTEITNGNNSVEKMTTIQSPRKFGTEITNGNNSSDKITTMQSPRKFGTEITNTGHSTPFNNNALKNVSDNDLESVSDIWCTSSMNDSVGKENFILNKSPKKLHNKTNKILGALSPIQIHKSSSKIDNRMLNLANKVGAKKTLIQSNLNNFLNLTDMTESNFDNAHTTLVSDQHAFGFSDDETDLDIPSIDNSVTSQYFRSDITEAPLLKPARISIGEIKNKLLIKNKENDEKITKKLKEKNALNSKNVKVSTDQFKENTSNCKKIQIDAVSFSDTFDVLSEKDQLPTEESICPLFMDTEPTHFSTPPRYSYKRKREVRFDLLDEEEEPKHKVKKKNKLTKLEEKRMQEWVQNVNKTFDEIDDFNLVVE